MKNKLKTLQIFVWAIMCAIILFSLSLSIASLKIRGTKEIYAWYTIDWGADYEADFKTVRSMNIDGVFLRSNSHTFLSDSEAFVEAIACARSFNLSIGIIVFHPYDMTHQEIWGLPVNGGTFSDIANKTWIEKVYITKLRNLVSLGDSLGVSYYVFDDMTFDKASNLTNAQLFIDITEEVTNGRSLMLACYPPENITVFLQLRINKWDWYTAPENVGDIMRSRAARPRDCSSIGQFLWLNERTDISLNDLKRAYRALASFDRLELFELRYGRSDWENGIDNSILEHKSLVEQITEQNKLIK